MAHQSIQFLTAEHLELRDRVEKHLVSLEGITFAGVSLLPGEVGLAAKITVGTNNLPIGKAQLINIVPYLEREAGLVNVEIVLTRGRAG